MNTFWFINDESVIRQSTDPTPPDGFHSLDYTNQPERLKSASKAQKLIDELAGVEALFAIRMGVEMRCGDLRIISANGFYHVQEQRHMRNGESEWRLISKHETIMQAVVAFRQAVLQ